MCCSKKVGVPFTAVLGLLAYDSGDEVAAFLGIGVNVRVPEIKY